MSHKFKEEVGLQSVVGCYKCIYCELILGVQFKEFGFDEAYRYNFYILASGSSYFDTCGNILIKEVLE